MSPNAKRYDYDKETYRSFASIPIGPIDENSQPFGVLVATSDQINRFYKGNCLILTHVADTLANVIHLIELSTD
jgi:GAF domain-containing protein